MHTNFYFCFNVLCFSFGIGLWTWGDNDEESQKVEFWSKGRIKSPFFYHWLAKLFSETSIIERVV